MNQETADQLLEINRAFYEQLAQPFADSRSTRQPGLLWVVERMAGVNTLLDVGCGNGRLAHALDEAGLAIRYTGVDVSDALLAIAARSASALSAVQAAFVSVDISREGWTAALPQSGYDAAALLAVLHHIPGLDRRARLLRGLRDLLTADGFLIVSTWQFLNEERLRRKIVPWEQVGLDAGDLEPGDYLLDWHRGGSGLRYCHLVDEREIEQVADEAGWRVIDLYYADGASQNLNLFALLR
ncbi:MAG: class I SAM-dependent methyltransferase [Caldilineales bacterium]